MDPDAVPQDRRTARDRMFRLNWLRATLTWLAFASFVLAAYVHLA